MEILNLIGLLLNLYVKNIKDFKIFFETNEMMIYFREILNIKFVQDQEGIISCVSSDNEITKSLLSTKIIFMKTLSILIKNFFLFFDDSKLEDFTDKKNYFLSFLQEKINQLLIFMYNPQNLIRILNGNVKIFALFF